MIFSTYSQCTTASTRNKTARHTQRLRAVLLIATALVLQSCTNSKLVIGPLYNQLDNQARKEFNNHGDFTAEQTAQFETRLSTFHAWHRRAELPRYADLISEIAGAITAEAIDPPAIERWYTASRDYSITFRECLPVNFMGDFIHALSDEQLRSIEQHWQNQRTENREEYAARTREERIQYRLDRMTKWARRIGVDFTQAQKQLLLGALQQQTSLRNEYYQLSEAWNEAFFTLARDRNNPDYTDNIQEHIAQLPHLLETHHSTTLQANRRMWKNTALQLAESLTSRQREKSGRWLTGLATTLNAVAKDQLETRPSNNPDHGCQVQTQGS